MNLRILIVADHASLKFGGEAALPLHYFRVLTTRRIPVWLVVHERTRKELQQLFPAASDNISYVADTRWHRLLNRLGSFLPSRLAYFTTHFILRCATQAAARKVVRKLIRDNAISVVHQPMPVSPKEPSMMYALGAPVIIGPMNGGMDYPAAFRREQSALVRITLRLGRLFATLSNTVLPGKRRATLLLVANRRTELALPHGVCPTVKQLVENGVDLHVWSNPRAPRPTSPVTRFVFVGRLVDWKAVDLLLMAFKQAAQSSSIALTIVGDGAERVRLEALAARLQLLGAGDAPHVGQVCFKGWMSQDACARQLNSSDALVLSSLMECGGAVVLEAMASGIPVIATDWGGPADYLDSSCGILVQPTSREEFIEGLAAAMVNLAKDPGRRDQLGQNARTKILQEFDWEVKVDRMLEFYQSVCTS